MSEYEWREDYNEDVKQAIEWAEWLANVKDPTPCLLAAKKYGEVLLKAYNQMSTELHAAEYGSP